MRFATIWKKEHYNAKHDAESWAWHKAELHKLKFPFYWTIYCRRSLHFSEFVFIYLLLPIFFVVFVTTFQHTWEVLMTLVSLWVCVCFSHSNFRKRMLRNSNIFVLNDHHSVLPIENGVHRIHRFFLQGHTN